MAKTFKYFAPAYLINLEKSAKPSLSNPVRVGGILSDYRKDVDKEIISKSSDWSYFESGFGKIKYEHSEIKEPECFIGSPTKLVKGNDAVRFEGELYPFDPDIPADKQPTVQKRLAKSTYDLLREIEDFNRRNPDSTMQQQAGWSIEGEYLSKEKNGLVKARIVNVVFTTKPRNMRTKAEILKSLVVGYGMEPSTQTGFGALRKESLEGSEKYHTLFNQQKGDKNKMFRNKEEVYKSAITGGKSHEDALKEAIAWQKKENEEIDSAYTKVGKSLGESSELLTKSVDAISDLSKQLKDIEVDFDMSDISTVMKKSIGTTEEEFDAIKFFGSVSKYQERNAVNMKAIDAKINALTKSVSLIAEGLATALESNTFAADIGLKTREDVMQLEKSLAVLTKSLRESGGSKPAQNLNGLTIADNAGADKGGSGFGPLNKSQKLAVLNGLAEAGQLEDQSVITIFEQQNFLDKKYADLADAKAKEMFGGSK